MTAPNTPTEPTVTATPEAARQTSIYSRILWISVGAILVLALAALLAWRLRPPELHGVLIQSPQEAADFTLMTSTGEPMSLSDFRGKFVLLYFGYTFCPDVCPTTLNDLKGMMEALGPKRAEDVQVIMVSVDPERDTVEQLSTSLPYFHPRLRPAKSRISSRSPAASASSSSGTKARPQPVTWSTTRPSSSSSTTRDMYA